MTSVRKGPRRPSATGRLVCLAGGPTAAAPLSLTLSLTFSLALAGSDARAQEPDGKSAQAGEADTLAQTPSASGSTSEVGDARDALPGIVNVPVAGSSGRTGFAAAASGGYGFIEGVLGHGDHHDRLFGSIAASVRPTPWLAFALRFDGRYDHDSDPVSGNASGYVGDPHASVRIGTNLAHGVRIGAQLGLWLPGDQAPSLVFKAATVDLTGVLSYAPEGSPVVATLHAGGRWDNSAESVPDASRLSGSERLGLGINDASGILTGAGVSYRVIPRLELLGDLSADWLVGSSAPSALASPIVAALGARWEANRQGTLSVQLALEASPSERPDLDPGQPLVDVEPRFAASFAVVLRPGRAAAPTPEPAHTEEKPADETVVATAPTTAAVKGSVTSASGAPLFHAQVRLTPPSGDVRTAETESDGGFEFDDVPLGGATLHVQATGYTAADRPVNVEARTADVAIALDQAIPSAQIRGLVRDFAGKPVAAVVVVDPLGTTVTVGADGSFSLDVKPGAYDVSITAKGYASQRRKVVVEPQGVTLLNVDLRGAR